MDPDQDTTIDAQAIDWMIRQRDPGFAEWDAFADWLAEDPGHGEAYEAIADFDQDLDRLTPAITPSVVVPFEKPRRIPRAGWFGGAIAAALIAAVMLPSLGFFGDPDRIETAAGERRTINLSDGSRIEINGASMVQLDKDRPRFARLESGEAMFHVVHRESDPFIVETGDARIVDLGTAFNIVRRDRETSVTVSEGVVLYNPDRDNVRIDAGQGIDARDGHKVPPKVRSIDIANVGGWRNGLLVYDGASLNAVAEDLKRTAGLQVTISPAAANLSFRGALIIDKDRSRTIADLAALSGTRAERQGDRWVLTR